MDSWIDLEKRFRALAPQLAHARIDDQTGVDGEYWRIAGTATNNETVREFELLCAVAGSLISDLDVYPPEIVDHTDTTVRWFRLMKANSATYRQDIIGTVSTSDGEVRGHIVTANIDGDWNVRSKSVFSAASRTSDQAKVVPIDLSRLWYFRDWRGGSITHRCANW